MNKYICEGAIVHDKRYPEGTEGTVVSYDAKTGTVVVRRYAGSWAGSAKNVEVLSYKEVK